MLTSINYIEFQVDHVTCHCDRHSKNCGCLSEAFLKQAKTNHFCCLVQAQSPEQYADTLLQLATYHARDIHVWEGGKCSFHPTLKCSCGNCEDIDNIQCAGTPYTTRNKLTCKFHALCYQIVLSDIAADSEHIIHREMLRGNSNICENTFSVVAKFRRKDKALEQKSYNFFTDIGLAQSNLTWARNEWGEDYHWVNDFLGKFGLTSLPVMKSWISQVADQRAKDLLRKKTEACKQGRNLRKRARLEEQETRKRWTKKQKVAMTYGPDDNGPDLVRVCKSCGNEGHLRSTSSLCLNYKKK